MAQTQAAAEPARRGGGRPPLTESRKDEIRLKIATEAVRLFTEHGLEGTSVAQIAEAAGIATRTLWRYFPSKEACAAPLLAFGLDRFTSYVRDWPADRPLAGAADDTAWFSDASPGLLLLVIDLLRLTHTEPLLDAVWGRCYSEAVAPLAVVLGERLGLPGGDLRVRVKASMLLAAMHQGLRHYVGRAPGEHGLSLEDTIRAAARIGLAAAEAPVL
ncbi:MAG: TetR/AcrR family transcriptional regulator [Catenulispora sp.]